MRRDVLQLVCFRPKNRRRETRAKASNRMPKTSIHADSVNRASPACAAAATAQTRRKPTVAITIPRLFINGHLTDTGTPASTLAGGRRTESKTATNEHLPVKH